MNIVEIVQTIRFQFYIFLFAYSWSRVDTFGRESLLISEYVLELNCLNDGPLDSIAYVQLILKKTIISNRT